MKKLLCLLALLLCLPGPGLATMTSAGTLGTASSITSGTTLVLTPTASLNIDNCGILSIAYDNTATTDGEISEITSVVDSAGGNTYTLLKAFRNGNGGAAAGASLDIWQVRAVNAVTTSHTVTITFSNTIASKAAHLWEFTCDGAIQVAGSATVARVAATAGSQSLASLPSKEYLFFRGYAAEDPGIAWTATTNYTKITQASADTGNNNTSMCLNGEFRIVTATGETSNPTSADLEDAASIFLAIEEVAGAGPTCPKTLTSMGVGC